MLLFDRLMQGSHFISACGGSLASEGPLQAANVLLGCQSHEDWRQFLIAQAILRLVNAKGGAVYAERHPFF